MASLARWLLDFEASAADPAGEKSQEVFSVCGKLKQRLSTLAGTAGFRALLSRSLTLAQMKAPCLKAVRVEEDGSLTLSPSGECPLNKEEIAKAEAALVAQLLDLLATFVGESLTLILVREIWPEAPYKSSDAGTEEGV
jgi:hypothetical protein